MDLCNLKNPAFIPETLKWSVNTPEVNDSTFYLFLLENFWNSDQIQNLESMGLSMCDI